MIELLFYLIQKTTRRPCFDPFFGVFEFFQTKNGDMTKIHYLVASNLVFQQKDHF